MTVKSSPKVEAYKFTQEAVLAQRTLIAGSVLSSLVKPSLVDPPNTAICAR